MTNLLAGCDGFEVGAAEGAGSREHLAGALAAIATLFPALLRPRRAPEGWQAWTWVPGASLRLLAGCPNLTSMDRTRWEQEALCVQSGGCAPCGSTAFGPRGFEMWGV